MNKPIALQLYTVRDALQADFEGTIRRVAEMGYIGVETAGFPGTTPQAAAELFKSLDLEVCAAHSPLPLGDAQQEVIEMAQAIGTPTLVCPWLNPEEHWSSVDQIKATAAMLNQGAEVAKAHGMRFAYHNHHFEYLTVDGLPAYKYLLEEISDDVLLEVDVYWVKVGGQDPVAVINELGARAKLLHIKDGPANREDPMTAVGYGVVAMPPIIRAGNAHADWMIVELDRCATDMLEAVEKSYEYLVGEGLTTGKK